MVYADTEEDEIVRAFTAKYATIKVGENGFKAEFTADKALLLGSAYVVGKYADVSSATDSEVIKTYLYFDKNADDAVAGATTEVLVTLGDSISANLTSDEPAREGYEFGGWAADADGTAIGDAVMTANGYTAYAIWEADLFTVSFTAGANGSLEGTTTLNVPYGTAWTEITVPTPVAEYGYKFDGWDVVFPETVTEDIEATAIFVKDESLWHTIKFVSAVGGYLEGTVEYTDILNGTAMADLVPEAVATEGYTFKGWSPAIPATVTESATYVAEFTTAYDMPFDITSAIYDPASGKLTVEGTAENAQDVWNAVFVVYANVDDVDAISEARVVKTYTATYGTIKNGEGFTAEFVVDSALLTGNVYVLGKYAEVTSSSDVERVKTYLYFDKNAEDAVAGATTEALVYINDKIADNLTEDAPTREGYGFGGWAADADGTAIGDAVMTSAGYTAYAVWRADMVSVEYELVATEEWYVVGETLDATTYDVYRIFENGDRELVDKSLYTVSALPTTADKSYAECLGWQTIYVSFNDTVYGNLFEDTFDAFVIPDKLILEEESPLDRVAKDDSSITSYGTNVTDYLDYDVIMGMAAGKSGNALIEEFINLYFLNSYTDASSIDCQIRLVNADGSQFKSLYVGTGIRVQLVIEGIVYDEVQVVVKGDVDNGGGVGGNGIINSSDTSAMSKFCSNLGSLNGVYYLAADVVTSAIPVINSSDVRETANYCKNLVNLYNAWDSASHVYSRDYSALYSVARG